MLVVWQCGHFIGPTLAPARGAINTYLAIPNLRGRSSAGGRKVFGLGSERSRGLVERSGEERVKSLMAELDWSAT